MLEYEILKPGAEPQKFTLSVKDGEADAQWKQIRPVIERALGTSDFERVRVFWEGIYTDMFVDEIGQEKQLPRNDRATIVYRNNVMLHQTPAPEPETLPFIWGPAILFKTGVWF